MMLVLMLLIVLMLPCWRPAFYPDAAGLSAGQLEVELKLWTLVG
jgi:hypothetical protein